MKKKDCDASPRHLNIPRGVVVVARGGVYGGSGAIGSTST